MDTDYSPESKAWEDTPRMSFGDSDLKVEKISSPHFGEDHSEVSSAKETDDPDRKPVHSRIAVRPLAVSPPLPDSPSEEGAATARVPTKRDKLAPSPLKRSKSSSRIVPPSFHRGVSRLIQERKTVAVSTDLSSLKGKARCRSSLAGHKLVKDDGKTVGKKAMNLNWAQQELLREKEKLVRGMQRYARVKV